MNHESSDQMPSPHQNYHTWTMQLYETNIKIKLHLCQYFIEYKNLKPLARFLTSIRIKPSYKNQVQSSNGPPVLRLTSLQTDWPRVFWGHSPK